MRTPEERFCEIGEGASLFYRYWPAATPSSRKALILFHRGHEHSGRLQHIVDELNLPDFAMFAWDARGHGRSLEAAGNNPSLGTFAKDVDVFVRHVSDAYGIAMEDIAVVGQSVGSVLLSVWAHDYAPKIRCMVLASPAFKVKLYVPFARQGLSLWRSLAGEFHVNSYVKASALTHDPERIASYNSDPLIRRPIAVKVLLGLYSAADRVIADAQAIRIPTQLLVSGADYVVRLKPQFDFYDRLGSEVKEKHVFDGFYHDTLGEKDRHLPIGKAREFVLKMFAKPAQVAPLLDADQRGYTRAEFDALSRPLPTLSPAAINFGVSRLMMRTAGKLSDGVRLGLETGFDSGSTLDYVYRNQASGITPIGKLIDWFYVNSIGWRGIRARRDHIGQMLAKAMRRLAARSAPIRIVDIAAGHGRYVLETVAKSGAPIEQVLLRDYSDLNVRQGQALIREKGLERVARFEKGDAFDRRSLAELRPAPTLGVVSGLYELFPENRFIRNSLSGLADAIQPGGYLIYTGQPWHPQIEMIARVLSSHRNGKPWIMRRRTQGEMDDLVAAAGFRKLDQLTDEWGIFTVSLAERVNV